MQRRAGRVADQRENDDAGGRFAGEGRRGRSELGRRHDVADGGLAGQAGSMFGQVTQMGQQLPQMLGQAPQMFSGMLGPLMQGGMGGAPASAIPAGAGGAGIPSMGGLSSLAGGGGGGGLASGTSGPLSSFVRPANSFSTPNSPTLPGGWQGGPEPGGWDPGAHRRDGWRRNVRRSTGNGP